MGCAWQETEEAVGKANGYGLDNQCRADKGWLVRDGCARM